MSSESPPTITGPINFAATNFQLYSGGEPLFTIRCDPATGKPTGLEINPNLALDDAARGFWNMVANMQNLPEPFPVKTAAEAWVIKLPYREALAQLLYADNAIRVDRQVELFYYLPDEVRNRPGFPLLSEGGLTRALHLELHHHGAVFQHRVEVGYSQHARFTSRGDSRQRQAILPERFHLTARFPGFGPVVVYPRLTATLDLVSGRLIVEEPTATTAWVGNTPVTVKVVAAEFEICPSLERLGIPVR